MKSYIIDTEILLIDYLTNNLKYSNKDAKKLLTKGQIKINNKIVTQYNYQLKLHDNLTINNFYSKINNNIEIIYEDKNIIVINKPENLLTIATNNEKEKTLYHLVSSYLKQKNKNAKVFIIHRLDKETSGIVMFAKDEKTKKIYQDNWDNLVKYRGYIALVEGKVEKQSDTIIQYLKENNNHYVYATDFKNGKKAITKYKVIKENQNYSLLDIEIKTGRKNQIRVGMQQIGHPIVGDKKYGSCDNSLKRLGLCANKLIVTNIINHKDLVFEIEIPEIFLKQF